jgi:hypothetical protein
VIEAPFTVFEGNIELKSTNLEWELATAIDIADNAAAKEPVCTLAAPEIDTNSNDEAYDNAEVAERMRLRPNPAQGIQVRAEITVNAAEPARIEIFNLAGRKVAEEWVGGDGLREVILPPLARGIYLVRYTNGTSMDTQKLIIE